MTIPQHSRSSSHLFSFRSRWFAAVTAALVLSGCGEGSRVASNAGGSSIDPAERAKEEDCLKESPLLGYEGSQQPSKFPIPAAAAGERADTKSICGTSNQFRFGAGRADMTGPASGKGMNEAPGGTNYSRGIQQRQYARSFVIQSVCSEKRVAMVLMETLRTEQSVRDGVLTAIKADPVLSRFYGPENFMLSATHSHSSPMGYSHYHGLNLFQGGYEAKLFDTVVAGVMKALHQAHQSLEKNPTSGPLLLGRGELLGVNVNRNAIAFANNTLGERQQQLDTLGQEVDQNRLMTQLRLTRSNDRNVGAINWFAVHPTADSISYQVKEGANHWPISGDTKGFAMYVWERLMGLFDRSSEPNFVAAFQQSDAGDSQPTIPPDQATLESLTHRDEPVPLTIANGMSQLIKAIQLFNTAKTSLQGDIDFRMAYVKMDTAEVSDPVVLKSLKHPPELDSPSKRTCSPAYGYAALQALGSEISCANKNTVSILEGDAKRILKEQNVPVHALAFGVGCNVKDVPGLNLSCQAEKPIGIPLANPLGDSINAVATIAPFQIFRLGNLVVIGLPWEVTTMAGRRIRDTVLSVLKDVGVDYAVINGYSNNYVGYLTTREEYAVQQFAGACNYFGPWSLAVVQQELRKLAIAMRDGKSVEATKPGAVNPALVPRVFGNVLADIAPPGTHFGQLITDVKPTYQPGDAAQAIFQTASANHDYRLDDSFLWVEKKQTDGRWQVIARDRDPETTFFWDASSPQPQVAYGSATARIVWRIPNNAELGIYRLRHTGNYLPVVGMPVEAFEGVSSEFRVEGVRKQCAL